MKVCTRCKVERPLCEFHKCKTGRLGLKARCRSCTRIDHLKYKRENAEAIKKQQGERRAWLKENDIIQFRKEKTSYEYPPDKRKAWNGVALALAKGALVKMLCEKCGVSSRVNAHHDDYAKPLEVRWLCATHHREEHNG